NQLCVFQQLGILVAKFGREERALEIRGTDSNVAWSPELKRTNLGLEYVAPGKIDVPNSVIARDGRTTIAKIKRRRLFDTGFSQPCLQSLQILALIEI